MRNALRNFGIAHTQFANFWPKSDPNPNHNSNPNLHPDLDLKLTRTLTLTLTVAKSRSTCCKLRATVNHSVSYNTNDYKAVVSCEIKLFWNNFEIISVFYFICNHVWNWNIIISSAKRVLKLFQNYFGDIGHVGKYSLAAINLWNNFEIMSGKFPRLKYN